jgi:PEP-CTERM motif
MRRMILSSVVLGFALLFSSITASASNSSVNLSGPQTGIITFCSSMGDPVLSLNGLGGVATMGTGIFAGATGFTVTGAPMRFFSDGPNSFETPATVDFSLTGTSITGTLTDIKLTQAGAFIFLSGDLKVGSSNTQIGLLIDLPSGASIATLTGKELALLSVGEGLETPTPEPGTMLLFGSGLLLVAGALRRKLVGTASAA